MVLVIQDKISFRGRTFRFIKQLSDVSKDLGSFSFFFCISQKWILFLAFSPHGYKMIATTLELCFTYPHPKANKKWIASRKYSLHILCTSKRKTFPREPSSCWRHPIMRLLLAWSWSFVHVVARKSKYLGIFSFYMLVYKKHEEKGKQFVAVANIISRVTITFIFWRVGYGIYALQDLYKQKWPFGAKVDYSC